MAVALVGSCRRGLVWLFHSGGSIGAAVVLSAFAELVIFLSCPESNTSA